MPGIFRGSRIQYFFCKKRLSEAEAESQEPVKKDTSSSTLTMPVCLRMTVHWMPGIFRGSRIQYFLCKKRLSEAEAESQEPVKKDTSSSTLTMPVCLRMTVVGIFSKQIENMVLYFFVFARKCNAHIVNV